MYLEIMCVCVHTCRPVHRQVLIFYEKKSKKLLAMITLEGWRRGLSIFLVFGVSVPSLTVLLREGDYGPFIVSFFDLKPPITYLNLRYRTNTLVLYLRV